MGNFNSHSPKLPLPPSSPDLPKIHPSPGHLTPFTNLSLVNPFSLYILYSLLWGQLCERVTVTDVCRLYKYFYIFYILLRNLIYFYFFHHLKQEKIWIKQPRFKSKHVKLILLCTGMQRGQERYRKWNFLAA
jgi:hypothetical protein